MEGVACGRVDEEEVGGEGVMEGAGERVLRGETLGRGEGACSELASMSLYLITVRLEEKSEKRKTMVSGRPTEGKGTTHLERAEEVSST
jgi:hypothetical protein